VKTISVDDLLTGSLPENGWEKYHLYAFRDGDLVLYVGKSEQNIIDRLEEHLGVSFRSYSHVGKFIADNSPVSNNWYIDLRTLDDCGGLVWKYFPDCKFVDIDIAEQALIREFSPPLNTSHNANPQPLPEKYSQQKNQRVKDMYRRLFD
jgi:hypothetical protein